MAAQSFLGMFRAHNNTLKFYWTSKMALGSRGGGMECLATEVPERILKPWCTVDFIQCDTLLFWYFSVLRMLISCFILSWIGWEKRGRSVTQFTADALSESCPSRDNGCNPRYAYLLGVSPTELSGTASAETRLGLGCCKSFSSHSSVALSISPLLWRFLCLIVFLP